MTRNIALIALIVVGFCMGSAVLHIAIGFLSEGMIANRMKQYEQRWKEDDARIKALEQEIAVLETKRGELVAAAQKERVQAASVAAGGQKREQELLGRPLTPGETAARNATGALVPERLQGSSDGIAKGRLSWSKKTDREERKDAPPAATVQP